MELVAAEVVGVVVVVLGSADIVAGVLAGVLQCRLAECDEAVAGVDMIGAGRLGG